MEERRSAQRRKDDVDHCRLEEKVGLVQAELSSHIHPELDAICSALEGPKHKHLDGTEGPDREEEKGLLYKVDVLFEAQENGGLKTKIPRSLYATIIISTTSIITTVIYALSQTHPAP